MITIKNEFITAKFNTLGAELRSLIYNGREYMWQADPQWWAQTSPLMFPICGGLADDEYEFGGKTYTLKKHGYAKLSEFEVECQSDTSVTFLLKSNEESRKQFPFEYELRLIYTLVGKQLQVRNEVKNVGDDTMYFSIGSHEAYATPEGIEEYELVFPQKEKLYAFGLNGNLIGKERTLILDNADRLPLNKEYFSIDALVFPEIQSRSVILQKRDGSVAVRVEFDGFFNLMVWQKCGAPYICVEPWNGAPDFEGQGKDFTKKIGIQQVGANSTYVRTHNIEILK